MDAGCKKKAPNVLIKGHSGQIENRNRLADLPPQCTFTDGSTGIPQLFQEVYFDVCWNTTFTFFHPDCTVGFRFSLNQRQLAVTGSAAVAALPSVGNCS